MVQHKYANEHNWLFTSTLDSGIDIGPTFIDFRIFFRPYGLIKRHYVYNFLEFFPGPTDIFKFFTQKSSFLSVQSLHLFFLPNFLCPTFIQGPTFILFDKFSRPCPTSIPDPRVLLYNRPSTNLQLVVQQITKDA